MAADNDDACPADLPENGGSSETNPVIHVDTQSGETTVHTDGRKPS
ncbi:hypothetical protein NE236_38530 [Actinoallomurus purpureus]|nr:hypothetical protein [Actinoallomurus purpureus]MCO6010870.1 hypothetical protein [Actinoallomurus purpureus]